MAIPASHIVKVHPRVITAGSKDLEMNGLFITKNSLISATNLIMSFPSAQSVAKFFGTNSKEYEAAIVYFTGYQNRHSSPTNLYFARRINMPLSAWLRSAPCFLSLVELKEVKDASLVISIDSQAISINSLDFSPAGSHSDVANIIGQALSDKLPGTTCTFSSLTSAFTIKSPSTGKGSVISYASAPVGGVDLSELLGFTEAKGAVISQGQDPMNVDDQMSAIRNKSENWVSFTTLWEPEQTELLAWAKWANDNYGWLYIPWISQDNISLSTSSNDPASVLKKTGYDHVASVYGSLPYASFIMGAVASVAWERTNGAITFAFKKQSGLAAWVNDEHTATTLENKGCNYFGNFATRNAEFVFLYPGCLSSSDYGFIDAYINDIWLNNSIQLALMDGLSSSPRAPYTDRGYTQVRAWLLDPIKKAKNNAVIESGVELSELQKSQLYQEAGEDISQELWTKGYFLQIKDPGAKARAERQSPVISFWYTYGGAIHRINIASTAII